MNFLNPLDRSAHPHVGITEPGFVSGSKLKQSIDELLKDTFDVLFSEKSNNSLPHQNEKDNFSDEQKYVYKKLYGESGSTRTRTAEEIENKTDHYENLLKKRFSKYSGADKEHLETKVAKLLDLRRTSLVIGKNVDKHESKSNRLILSVIPATLLAAYFLPIGAAVATLFATAAASFQQFNYSENEAEKLKEDSGKLYTKSVKLFSKRL